MKKFYLLCATACVVASASAVEKEMKAAPEVKPAAATEKISVPKLKETPKAALAGLRKGKAVSTRAGEVEFPFYRPADAVMNLGMTSKGLSLNGSFGFASSYGTVDFINLSSGASSYVWNYSDVNDFEGDDFKLSTSSKVDLSVKSAVGEMMTPFLDVTYSSGDTGFYVEDKNQYMIGGSAEYWMGQANEEIGYPGVTFYQNMGLKDPEGYSLGADVVTAYWPGATGFNANGVYNYAENPNNWETSFSQELGKPVSNLMMDSYVILQPKPTSTYFFTKGWLCVELNAKAETMLTSYVYPVDEDGNMEEMPIAIGYAGVPKGSTSLLVFEYYPLNEDGDELEGEVYIDSAVAVTVEGFNGNDAISLLLPLTGYYPFPYDAYKAGNYDLWKDPTLYVNFSFEAGGETYHAMTYDGAGYYFDQRDQAPGVTLDRNTIAPLCYCVFTMDATYAYIHGVDDTTKVTLPIEGGKASVEINALYYNINQMIDLGGYEVTAPEWLSVSFGDSDYATGNTTMTVSAEATEASRSGVVSIEGLGATYSLTVEQGEGAAVSSISIDKNAEYFDLQGRRVANPDKGLYIKKAGNKAEKVIL